MDKENYRMLLESLLKGILEMVSNMGKEKKFILMVQFTKETLNKEKKRGWEKITWEDGTFY